MIKDADSKYDDYSTLPKISQILLHWGYELTEKKIFFWFVKLIYKKWVTTVLIDKSCKKKKKDILKKKQQIIMHKTKKE